MIARAVDMMNCGFSNVAEYAALSWALPDTLRYLATSGDRPIVVEVLTDFQTDTARRLGLLDQAIAKHDFAAVRVEVHAIRGAASEVGAEHLEAVCKQIELSAAAGHAADIARSQTDAYATFSAVCRSMNECGWLTE